MMSAGGVRKHIGEPSYCRGRFVWSKIVLTIFVVRKIANFWENEMHLSRELRRCLVNVSTKRDRKNEVSMSEEKIATTVMIPALSGPRLLRPNRVNDEQPLTG